ncbi:uroporphyrinogen decarboxylase/cobalamine-independent methonine synthase family protein [Actinokineospora pegani]|uniref:methionine synthase n=1 Tax=Actinokineospora pegani TaxID=2654637 RepID=UPI0012E9BECA|nr:methionine synthase [Actinokineospora pegani]
MTTAPWAPGAATGVGSLPGADPREAAAVVLGELPALPHLPELPGRGLGADMIGRAAALLVDLAVEVVPSGYRVTAHPGGDHRRAHDLLRRDVDAFDEAVERAGRPNAVKVQVAGPWTLGAGIELPRGHRVLTDRGALREFGDSLAEGLTRHVAEITRRTGAPVVVQVDEPGLPAVLAGSLPTASGYGMVPPVPAPEATEVLERFVSAARRASGQPVIAHCCAPHPPIDLLRAAGADALALDATLLEGIPAALTDQFGEAWDAGLTMFLGLVPSTDPGVPVTLRQVATPALRLVDRLGFDRTFLATRAVATPTCGMAGASQGWARQAMALARDLGKAFLEPPDSW